MGYDYIEKAYRKVFRPGDKVAHLEANHCGVVVRPKTSHLHYVRVNFFMYGVRLCHPGALKIIEEK